MINFIELLGAGFVGGIASFLANTIKEAKTKKKQIAAEYDNFKMQIFSELMVIHYELLDALEKRDYAHMEYIDELGIIRGDRHQKRNDGIIEEKDLLKAKLDEKNEIVFNLKTKFVKQTSFYLYKKKYNTKVKDYQSTLVVKGLNYAPLKYSDWNSENNPAKTKKDFVKYRKQNYSSFRFDNITMPLTQILRGIMDDI